MNKIKCTACGWVGGTEDMLSAQSPFKAETIYACPKCREIEQVTGVDNYEHPSLHVADLHKCISATCAGIYYHPKLRGKIDDQTSEDIVEMLTMCAEKVWKMGKEKQ